MDWTSPSIAAVQTPPRLKLKRRPSNDLSKYQRLSKRLETLTLRGKHRVIPSQSDTNAYHVHTSTPTTTSTPSTGSSPHPPKKKKDRVTHEEERMDVDNVIYISDLDAELESSDDEDPETKGKLIFVPDIERELTRIPHHVLRPDGQREEEEAGKMGQELVLYSVPRTLSVEDEQQDGVRKAIIESRARARRKVEEEAKVKAKVAVQIGGYGGIVNATPTASAGGFNGTPPGGFGVIPANGMANGAGTGAFNAAWFSGSSGGGGGYDDSDVDMDAMDIE